VIVEGISSEDFYIDREAESYVSHHQTIKHQCTHLGLGTELRLMQYPLMLASRVM